MRSTAILACATLLSLAGCGGSDEPPPRTSSRSSFEASPHGERVFAAYHQTGVSSQKVTLPKGSRRVLIQMDCAGAKGEVSVELTSAGGAGAECTPHQGARAASVQLAGDGSLLDREQTITVTGPGTQEWSVAVDAGATVGAN